MREGEHHVGCGLIVNTKMFFFKHFQFQDFHYLVIFWHQQSKTWLNILGISKCLFTVCNDCGAKQLIYYTDIE